MKAPSKLLVQALSPAILLDIHGALVAAQRLAAHPEAEPDLRRTARLRAADLIRRLDPPEALTLVEPILSAEVVRDEDVTAHVEAHRIAGHAHLDQGDTDDARVHLPLAGEGERAALLSARLTATRDKPAALRELDALLDDPEALAARSTPHLELCAEATAFRARWRAEMGHLHEAHEDARALARMTREHNAVATQLVADFAVRILDALIKSPLGTSEPRPLAGRFAEIAGLWLRAGAPADALEGSPIPTWLHGLMGYAQRHGGHQLVARGAQMMAGLYEASGQLEDAYRAFLYGRKLAQRVDDEAGAALLQRAQAAFQRRIGEEHAVALRDAESARLEALKPR